MTPWPTYAREVGRCLARSRNAEDRWIINRIMRPNAYALYRHQTGAEMVGEDGERVKRMAAAAKA